MIRATVAVALALIPIGQRPEQPPLPCLPLPLPPICPPPLPPPPGDDPPTFVRPLAANELRYRVVLRWAAVDDRGLAGFRIFRDGNYLGARGPLATTVRLRLPCGRHRYRVEAVDTAGQVASVSRRVRRAC